jgi:mRNA interferase MazF
MGKEIKQYEVFWVDLDPTQGSEMAKTRPCVVLSPDEMNDYLKTVTVAPLTTTLNHIQSRVEIFFNGQNGMVALDHIRSISKSRIKTRIGKLKNTEVQDIKDVIREMFVD